MSAETARKVFFLTGSSEPWKWLGGMHPLGTGSGELAEACGGRGAICWSGGLAEGLFEEDPGAWTGRGREALIAALDGLVGALGDRRLLLRPHHRHVISDVPACRWFAERWRGGPLGLALDAASMVAPEMGDRAEQALERAFDAVGPLCEAVALCNVRWDEGGAARPCGVFDGALDGGSLVSLALEHTPAGAAICLHEGDEAGRDAVIAALSCGG